MKGLPSYYQRRSNIHSPYHVTITPSDVFSRATLGNENSSCTPQPHHTRRVHFVCCTHITTAVPKFLRLPLSAPSLFHGPGVQENLYIRCPSSALATLTARWAAADQKIRAVKLLPRVTAQILTDKEGFSPKNPQSFNKSSLIQTSALKHSSQDLSSNSVSTMRFSFLTLTV